MSYLKSRLVQEEEEGEGEEDLFTAAYLAVCLQPSEKC